MAKPALDCTSKTTSNDWFGIRRATNRHLRQEILHLQERLKACEDTASRYAVMLREGDHRIKNSLQLVTSLMAVQARRENSAAVRDALNSAAARVSSIARMHDALQGTGGLDLLDLGTVLQKMATSLQAMAGEDGRVEVRVDVESVEFPVFLAQPLALAINELVVNALRHAFLGREKGVVQVTLSRTDDMATLSVADDGVGLPGNHVAGQGYGMTLVAMMVKQVGGELVTEGNPGVRHTIRAPLKLSR